MQIRRNSKDDFNILTHQCHHHHLFPFSSIQLKTQSSAIMEILPSCSNYLPPFFNHSRNNTNHRNLMAMISSFLQTIAWNLFFFSVLFRHIPYLSGLFLPSFTTQCLQNLKSKLRAHSCAAMVLSPIYPQICHLCFQFVHTCLLSRCTMDRNLLEASSLYIYFTAIISRMQYSSCHLLGP